MEIHKLSILVALSILSAIVIYGAIRVFNGETCSDLEHPASGASAPEPPKFNNSDYLGDGYNIFLGNPHNTEGLDPGFTIQTLYEFTYKENKTTSDGRYRVPDQATIRPTSACSFEFSSYGTQDVGSYFDSLKVEVEADFSGWGASFSGSANYRLVEKSTASAENRYVSSKVHCEVYIAALNPGANLSDGFIQSVNLLPTSGDDWYDEYHRFIENYGTHYTRQLTMGGSFGIQTEFSSSSYTKMVSTGLEISTAAGYSATMDINARVLTSTEKEEAREFNSYQEGQRIFNVGGRPPTDPKTGSDELWIQSVQENPLPVQYKLNEIADLFTPDYFKDGDIQTKQTLLKKAIFQYCNQTLQLTGCGGSGPTPVPRIKIILSKNVSRIDNNVFWQPVDNPSYAVMGMFLRSGSAEPTRSYAIVDSENAPSDLITKEIQWMRIINDKPYWRPICPRNFTRLADFSCPMSKARESHECLDFLPTVLPCVANHCLRQCSATEVKGSNYNEYYITNGFPVFGNGNPDTDGTSGSSQGVGCGVVQHEVFKAGEDGYHCFRIPALVFTVEKTLLAFAEGRGLRSGNCDDNGTDVQIVMKRSSDSGETWSNLTVVHSEAGYTIGNPAPVVDKVTGKLLLVFCRDNKEVFTIESNDDGVTWVNIVNITSIANWGDWSFVGTGPPGGIQLSSGRIVVGTYAASGGPGSYVIYSDDAGKTWHHSTTTGNTSTGECQVASLGSTDSQLLILAMRSTQYGRLLAYSEDSGETWTNLSAATTLAPQTSCEGSILSVPFKEAFMNTGLYFSAPHSTGRMDMTVFASFDGGKSWKTEHVLWIGPSGYSSLAWNQVKMYCLYERGLFHYTEKLTLAVFSPSTLS